MPAHKRTGLLLLSLLLISMSTRTSSAELMLPAIGLRFHVVTELEIPKAGIRMTQWIGESDLRDTVLPAVNALWSPAGISFNVESIRRTPSVHPGDREQRITKLAQAQRDDEGHADKQRLTQLEGLIDWTDHDDRYINVYLVPYLGETSQGNARPRQRRIFISEWTDKPSGGRRPPEPVLLVEPPPYRQGSFSRTLAHEIGHILGLKHPEKKSQTEFGLLMGGRKPGYRLTAEDIHIAREQALRLAW